MMKETIAYVLSVSFQLSGAVLLLLYAFSTKRERVIISFFKNSFSVLDGETEALCYDHDAFVKEYMITYSNKIAVFLLCSGYLIGIWGKFEGQNKWLICGIILITTIAIVFVAITGVKLFVSRAKKVQRIVANEELESIGISSNMKSLSKKDLDELFDMNAGEAKKPLR